MNTPEGLCHHLTKGDNFTNRKFGYLVLEIIKRWGLLLKENICSHKKCICQFLKPRQTASDFIYNFEN